MLFVTWDGPRQPYLNSLFIPTLLPLCRAEESLRVLQYSWGGQPPLPPELGRRVTLVPRPVLRHLGPAAVALHVAQGAVDLSLLAEPDEVVLVRSYIPAGMALGAQRLRPSLRFYWDLDGFMPDERVEFGGWRQGGLLHKTFLQIEHRALEKAACSIVRTESARRVLLDRNPDAKGRIEVVGNGRDPELFAPGSSEGRSAIRSELGIPDSAFVVGYVGSFGPQYLPRRLLETVRVVLRQWQDAYLLVLTGMPSAAEDLFAEFRDSGRMSVRSVAPEAVGRFIATMDVGVALRAASPSQAGVSPLKVGEYLLAGVPVVASAGVGDIERLCHGCPAVLVVGHEGVGVAAIDWMAGVKANRNQMREQARSLGIRHFSLESAVAGYARVLTGRPCAS